MWSIEFGGKRKSNEHKNSKMWPFLSVSIYCLSECVASGESKWPERAIECSKLVC